LFHTIAAVIECGSHINKTGEIGIKISTSKASREIFRQSQPIFRSGNRWIDQTGNDIHADALKKKSNLSRSGRKMETLRKVWHGWKRFGQFMGDLIGRLVLTVFYFTLFMPFGLGVRFLGDPLALRHLGHSKWLERTTKDLTLDDTRRLY
jgi:hypothetical protein